MTLRGARAEMVGRVGLPRSFVGVTENIALDYVHAHATDVPYMQTSSTVHRNRKTMPGTQLEAPGTGWVVTVIVNAIESDAGKRRRTARRPREREGQHTAQHSTAQRNATRRKENGESQTMECMSIVTRVRRREEREAVGKEGTLVGFCAAFEHS